MLETSWRRLGPQTSDHAVQADIALAIGRSLGQGKLFSKDCELERVANDNASSP